MIWTWNTLFTGIVLLTILLAETSRLLRGKAIREWLIFCSFWVFASVAAMAQVMHASLPNPLDWIAIIFGPVNKSILSLFE